MSDALAIAACGLIALGVGSNDTSNALGICIGCGIISFRRAVAYFAVLVLLGIVLQGDKVMSTVGKDLVAVSPAMLGPALGVSACLIIISNWKRIPLSTHQVIIGSLIGAGAALDAKPDYLRLSEVLISWAISPIVACLIGYVIYRAMERTISRFPVFRIERMLRVLLLLSGGLIAYNTGANELATVLGPVVHSGLSERIEASLGGSLLVFVGAYFISYRVVETVGKGITALDPYSGFAAQFGAGCCVLLFTFLGMPISTTYCIIGAISGVGLVKGVETVRAGLIKKILANWILAPSIAFVLCYLLVKALG
jgi:PiT family inorganic phosphate transporter